MLKNLGSIIYALQYFLNFEPTFNIFEHTQIIFLALLRKIHHIERRRKMVIGNQHQKKQDRDGLIFDSLVVSQF